MPDGTRVYSGVTPKSGKNAGRAKSSTYKPGQGAKGPQGSKTTARASVEVRRGKALPKNVHVDHRDNNKKNNSAKNLRPMKASANIAKGNRNR
jgi:hypothetical protein